MNEKLLACVVIWIVMILMYSGTTIMSKRTGALRTEAESIKSSGDTTRLEAETARITALRLKNDSQDLLQFLDTWTPAINRMQTNQDAEQALLSVIRNSGILVVSQKLEIKENRANAMMPRALQGTIVIQDEYPKSMNWLGELECKVPLIRISSCRIKQGETGRQVNMELRFEVPLIDLNAKLDNKK